MTHKNKDGEQTHDAGIENYTAREGARGPYLLFVLLFLLLGG